MTTLSIGHTHRGTEAWIDDVVTDLRVRGHGFSKPLMSWAEGLAAQHTDVVQLTSSVTRKEARTGYLKRGYELHVGTPIFRNKALGHLAVPSNVEPLEIATLHDTRAIAEATGQDPAVVDKNLGLALDSPASSLFVARGLRGAIDGIATRVAYAIPVGWKAWAHVDAPDPQDIVGLLAIAEQNVPDGVTALNTMFAPPAGAESYEIRESGLYTLPLAAR